MDIEFYESATLVDIPDVDAQKMAVAEADYARVLSRLECSHTVRSSKPGENIEYNACNHDYTLCNNSRCIKKLV